MAAGCQSRPMAEGRGLWPAAEGCRRCLRLRVVGCGLRPRVVNVVFSRSAAEGSQSKPVAPVLSPHGFLPQAFDHHFARGVNPSKNFLSAPLMCPSQPGHLFSPAKRGLRGQRSLCIGQKHLQ